MTLDQLISDNMATLIMGSFGLVATVVTIRLTMRQVVRDVASLTGRLNNHSDRIKDLEVKQAERLGYERAMTELKQRIKVA
jgi:hypothetical protein